MRSTPNLMVATSVIFGLAVLARAQTASLLNLGALYPTDINNNGQITGSMPTPDGFEHAFLYSDGAIQDLGTLGGGNSSGWGINDSGQITGWSSTSDGRDRAFLYSGGVMQNIDSSDGRYSFGSGINNSGEVTGTMDATDSFGSSYAFSYTGGTLKRLTNLSRGGRAINNNGQITGYAASGGSPSYAFLYSGGQIHGLGTLGGNTSVGEDINDRGQITGWSITTDGQSHAFLYHDGVMHDIGALSSSYPHAVGQSINNAGEIVGYASAGLSPDIAFIYRNGVMRALSDLLPADSGWVLQNATGINDNGQIIGIGIHQGQSRAFLMTIIPEPATTIGAAMMLRGMVATRRRSIIP